MCQGMDAGQRRETNAADGTETGAENWVWPSNGGPCCAGQEESMWRSRSF